MYESQRGRAAQRAQRERQWATTGVTQEKKNPRDNDKAQRKFRINRTENLAARARRTERALEALEAVEKPWEGWDLRFTITRRPGRATSSCAWRTPSSSAATSRSGHSPRHRLGGARSRSSGRTARARRRSSRRCSGGCRSRRARGAWVRAWSSASWPRTDASCGAASSLADAFTARDGAAARPGALAAGQVRSRRRRRCSRPSSSLSPGERTRAELAAFCRARRQLPRARRADQPSRPAGDRAARVGTRRATTGTLLLVSHDRRLLETVSTTRRVELPGLGQAGPRPARAQPQSETGATKPAGGPGGIVASGGVGCRRTADARSLHLGTWLAAATSTAFRERQRRDRAGRLPAALRVAAGEVPRPGPDLGDRRRERRLPRGHQTRPGRHRRAPVFDVFPDNPDDPATKGVRNLKASLMRVPRERTARRHVGPEVRHPAARSRRAAASRSASGARSNSPVLAPDGSLAYIIHQVEDVTEFIDSTRARQERPPSSSAQGFDDMEADVVRRAREVGRLGPGAEGGERGARGALRTLPGARPPQDTVLLQREPRAPHSAGPHPRPGRAGAAEPTCRPTTRHRRDLEVILRNARVLLGARQRPARHLEDRGGPARARVQRSSTSATWCASWPTTSRRSRSTAPCTSSCGRPAGLPAVQVDPRRVQQVLLNLLSNAFKFTPADGTVRIELHDATQWRRRRRSRWRTAGRASRPDQRDEVFERFHQLDGGVTRAKMGGTGLGPAHRPRAGQRSTAAASGSRTRPREGRSSWWSSRSPAPAGSAPCNRRRRYALGAGRPPPCSTGTGPPRTTPGRR